MSRTYHHGTKARERNQKMDYWYRNEPRWWRKEFKHKPQRARARQCEHRVLRGELEVHWPLDRKPWLYYW